MGQEVCILLLLDLLDDGFRLLEQGHGQAPSENPLPLPTFKRPITTCWPIAWDPEPQRLHQTLVPGLPGWGVLALNCFIRKTLQKSSNIKLVPDSTSFGWSRFAEEPFTFALTSSIILMNTPRAGSYFYYSLWELRHLAVRSGKDPKSQPPESVGIGREVSVPWTLRSPLCSGKHPWQTSC